MAILSKRLKHGGKRENVPNRIVVHCMAEYIKDPHPIHAPDFLDQYKLSAHALVSPSGDIIICRYDHERAWHARGYNTNSLGIEFLVEGEHDYASFVETIKEPYLTTIQFETGVDAVRSWIETYDIQKVERHSDLSPGRKVDPGRGFPWQIFLQRVGWIAR